MIETAHKDNWTGRIDVEDGDLGLRWHQVIQLKNINDLTPTVAQEIALLGFACDEGVRRNKGRIGAAASPNIIRQALSNLPFHHQNQYPITDFGNIVCQGENLELARELQFQTVSQLIRNNYFPIILGGGHETALGDFWALAENYDSIGIINIDAHFDLRIPVENSTSGTPFYEMATYCKSRNKSFNYFCMGIQPNGNTQALFERAKELNVETILADEIHENIDLSLRKLHEFIQKHSAIYLSLDLDVLDGAFAPGVSAPSVNGLNPHQVKTILDYIFQTNKIKLFDIVELNPNFDQDSRTAKLAANFIQIFTTR